MAEIKIAGCRSLYRFRRCQDWKNPIFVKLLTNSLFWAADFKPGEINQKRDLSVNFPSCPLSLYPNKK